MYQTMTARLAVVILAAASASSATAALPGCGQPHSSGEGRVPLASMRKQTPLYVMEGYGRLVKMDLRTGVKTTLADHGFDSEPNLRPSGDGRWLSYSGAPKGTDKTQYWLVDRHNDSKQLVYEHPPFGGGISAFSPDSRYLLINANWADASRAGIYLFDTTAMRLHSVPLPVNANRALSVSAAWSQDGKELLILVRTRWTKEGFDYFSYGLATKRIDAVTGRYNNQTNRHEFSRGAHRIPAFEEIVPRSQLAGRSEWSPGRSWRAHIDEHQDDAAYQLLVTNSKGATRPVVAGRYERCAGHTLFISGWLDDRHLIYRNSLNFFIFDAQTGSIADLFSNKDVFVMFTW
jgi:dipeptidyl aminopeptidase/acylaminoacyl peptidase